MRVELRIEALVLEGFPAMDYGRCGAALREELARLMGERGVPEAWRKPWRSDVQALGSLALPRGAEPEWIGVQLARQLYDGLRPSVGSVQPGDLTSGREPSGLAGPFGRSA